MMTITDSISLAEHFSQMQPGETLSGLSFDLIDEHEGCISLENSTILCRERHSTKKDPNKIKQLGYRFEVFTRDSLGNGVFGQVYPISATLKLNTQGHIEILKDTKQRVVKILDSPGWPTRDETLIGIHIPYLHMKPTIQDSELIRYIIMHKVPGKNLGELLRNGTIKELPKKIKFLLLIRILEAIKNLHSDGIIHLDIKPDNIMVHFEPGNIDPKINIIDFGCSEYSKYKNGSNIDEQTYHDQKDPNSDIRSLINRTLSEINTVMEYPNTLVRLIENASASNFSNPLFLQNAIKELTAIYTYLDKKTMFDEHFQETQKIGELHFHEPRPGLFRLDTIQGEKALAGHFQGQTGYIPQYLDAEKTQINPLRYFINETNKIIVFASPIEAVNLSTYLNALKTYSILENIDDYHLVIPLIGQGITERHIVSYYKAPGTKSIPHIFDSKRGDPKRFFNSKENSAIPNVNYVSLETQSFFDPVSCGYHGLANIANIVLLIQAGKPVNTTSLLKTLEKNNLNNFSIPLLKNSDIPLKINYFAFIQQAWRDTFFSGLNQQEITALTFKHYFLGWPIENAAWKKMLYTTLLGFLFYPLINTLKLLIELPIQILKNSADYIKNQLFLWAPTSAVLQYLRNSLLLTNYLFYGVLKGLSLIIHMSLSLIPTPCTLNAQQKEAINNGISIKVDDTTSDYDFVDMNDWVVKSHYPETTKPSNASAKFFKPATLQAEEQRQEESIESSASNRL
ncbi:protein kinase domain-containing protein [Candidatus Rickettsiella viridis]|nr:protein kinase [Candidatus Rickettsiella viridis]